MGPESAPYYQKVFYGTRKCPILPEGVLWDQKVPHITRKCFQEVSLATRECPILPESVLWDQKVPHITRKCFQEVSLATRECPILPESDHATRISPILPESVPRKCSMGSESVPCDQRVSQLQKVSHVTRKCPT